MPNNWTSEVKGSVVTVRLHDIACGDPVWVLLRSDAHHDSPHCNREFEKKHLDLALERDAFILDAGDTFDAMQGKFDPRRSMDDVRPEDRRADYYDSIVTHAAEDYLPYAQNWVMFGKGNHEDAVRDKANTDLISNLVYRLNSESKANILTGNYGGYVRFMFNIHKTRRMSKWIRYHHGSGGAAPVTRGVIQTNRQQVFLPDADVIWNGHNHQSYIVPIKRERVNNAGVIYFDNAWHVRTPGYKEEYRDPNSYSFKNNSGPTPLGCVWLKFEIGKKNIRVITYQDIA